MASPHDAIDLTGDSDEEEPQLAVAGPVSESGEEPEPMPLEAVRAVLQHERLKLGQYAENLVAAGYDDVRYMRHLTTEELRVAGREHASMKQGHAAKFAKWFHEAAGGMLPDTAAAAGGGSAGSSESHASAAGAAGGAPLAALSSDDQEVAGRLLPFLKDHGRREEAAAAKAVFPPHAHGTPAGGPAEPAAGERAARQPLRQRLPRGAAGFIRGRAAHGLLSIAGHGDGDAALRELRARAEAQYRQKAVTGESSHCAGHGTVRLVEFVDGGQAKQLGLDLPGIEAPANTFRIDKDFSYGLQLMHRGFLTKTHKDQAGVMPLIVRGDSLFLVWSLEDGLKAGLTGGGGAAETPESEWEHEWLPPEEGGEEGGEPRPGAWRRFASMPSAAMARLWRGGRASGARGRRGAPACGTVALYWNYHDLLTLAEGLPSCALERASSGELPARLLKAICAEADQSGAAAPNLATIARRWRERTGAAKTFLERLSAPGANIAHTSVESADAAEAEAAALLEGASKELSAARRQKVDLKRLIEGVCDPRLCLPESAPSRDDDDDE
ncbi:hypothetical protein EMIHUDRAFT_449491 [Emiliania huxleyi CCMP1516]|uniref:SAM domain-containing protein n=2 Tax=Emiliania huxleyi TaxID=2903 RepID=A0A0D3K8H4_EMIH1|nr:hypothetical protein EMIHUDRAFT_449491 [Emiliania huxleyi CCMP1516]EOD32059.1 hypothetical protein EMIHUDRAFT_449491 [Emiliania huxleyi CCMP1516]|eukprot:XP_005784488.1 hypothetical protein EMIHUDRAFT_449491 [Emiliania huxleyi CCMP1516]